MLTLARKEFVRALHDGWVRSYVAAMGALGLIATWTAARSSAGLAFETFGRTSATLVNLALMLAPLVGLFVGAACLVGERERGTLDRLLAQPLRRVDLIDGKFLGVSAALILATLLGFGPAAIATGVVSGPKAFGVLTLFAAIASILVTVMLALGIWISARSTSAAQAQGSAILAWFSLVILYELILLGTLMAGGFTPAALAALLVANPVTAARLLATLALDTELRVIGPVGLWLTETLGVGGTAALLLASLGASAGSALLGARRVFARPGAALRRGRLMAWGRRWISHRADDFPTRIRPHERS